MAKQPLLDWDKALPKSKETPTYDPAKQVQGYQRRIEGAGLDAEAAVDDRNALEKVLNLKPNQNTFWDIMEIINRPQQAIFSGIKEGQAGRGFGKGLLKGITGQTQITGKELLTQGQGAPVFLDRPGKIDFVDIAGFALDVFADPIDIPLLPITGAAGIAVNLLDAANDINKITDSAQAIQKGFDALTAAKKGLKVKFDTVEQFADVLAATKMSPADYVKAVGSSVRKFQTPLEGTFRGIGKGLDLTKTGFDNMLNKAFEAYDSALLVDPKYADLAKEVFDATYSFKGKYKSFKEGMSRFVEKLSPFSKKFDFKTKKAQGEAVLSETQLIWNYSKFNNVDIVDYTRKAIDDPNSAYFKLGYDEALEQINKDIINFGEIKGRFTPTISLDEYLKEGRSKWQDVLSTQASDYFEGTIKFALPTKYDDNFFRQLFRRQRLPNGEIGVFVDADLMDEVAAEIKKVTTALPSELSLKKAADKKFARQQVREAKKQELLKVKQLKEADIEAVRPLKQEFRRKEKIRMQIVKEANYTPDQAAAAVKRERRKAKGVINVLATENVEAVAKDRQLMDLTDELSTLKTRIDDLDTQINIKASQEKRYISELLREMHLESPGGFDVMISDAQQALESGKLKLKGQYASMEDYLAKVDKKDIRQVADATKENVITEVNRVGGVTVIDGKVIDATSGYQVGIDKLTEQSFETMDDLMDAVVAKGYNNYGVWKSSKTGRWVLDPSSRYVNDLDDALNIGATSKQITIWDWKKKQEWSVSTRKVIKMPKTPGSMGGSGAAPSSTPAKTPPTAPATPVIQSLSTGYVPPSQGKTIKVGDRVISEVNIKRNLETFADDPSVDAIQETKNALRGIGERFKTFQSQNQGPLSKLNPSPYTVPSVEELDAFVDEVVAGMRTSDALPTAPTPTLEGLPTATPTPVVQPLSATPAVPTAKVPGRVRKYNTDTFKAADDYITTSRTKVRDTIEGANFTDLPETPKTDSMVYSRYEELRGRFEEVFGADDEMNDLLDSLEGYLPEKKHQQIMDMIDEYGNAGGDELLENRNRMEEIFDQLSDPNLDDAAREVLSDELDELSDTVQGELNDGFYQGELPDVEDFTLDEEFKVATPEEREVAKRGIDILDNDGNVYKNVNKIDEETIKDIAVYKDDIVTSDTGAVSYKKKYTIPLTSGEGEIYIQAPQIRNKNAYVVYQDNYQVMLNDSPLFTKIDKYSDEPVTFMTKTQAAKKVREAYKADLAKLEGKPYNAKALQTEEDWFTEVISKESPDFFEEVPKKEALTLEGIPSKVEPEVVKTSAPAYNKVEGVETMAKRFEPINSSNDIPIPETASKVEVDRVRKGVEDIKSELIKINDDPKTLKSKSILKGVDEERTSTLISMFDDAIAGAANTTEEAEFFRNIIRNNQFNPKQFDDLMDKLTDVGEARRNIRNPAMAANALEGIVPLKSETVKTMARKLDEIPGANLSTVADNKTKRTANLIYKNNQQMENILNMSFEDIEKSGILKNEELLTEVTTTSKNALMNSAGYDANQLSQFLKDNNLDSQDLIIKQEIISAKINAAKRLPKVADVKPDSAKAALRDIDNEIDRLKSRKIKFNQVGVTKYDELLDREINKIQEFVKDLRTKVSADEAKEAQRILETTAKAADDAKIKAEKVALEGEDLPEEILKANPKMANIKDKAVKEKIVSDFNARNNLINYQEKGFEYWNDFVKKWEGSKKTSTQFRELTGKVGFFNTIKEDYLEKFPNLPKEQLDNIGFLFFDLSRQPGAKILDSNRLTTRYNMVETLKRELGNSARTGKPYYQEEYLDYLYNQLKDSTGISQVYGIRSMKKPYETKSLLVDNDPYAVFRNKKEVTEKATLLKEEVLKRMKKHTGDRSFLYTEIRQSNLDYPRLYQEVEQINNFYKFYEDTVAYAKKTLPKGAATDNFTITGKLATQYANLPEQAKPIAAKYYEEYKYAKRIYDVKAESLLESDNFYGDFDYINRVSDNDLLQKYPSYESTGEFIRSVKEQAARENPAIYEMAALKQNVFNFYKKNKLFTEAPAGRVKEITSNNYLKNLSEELDKNLITEIQDLNINSVANKRTRFPEQLKYLNKADSEKYTRVWELADEIYTGDEASSEVVKAFEDFRKILSNNKLMYDKEFIDLYAMKRLFYKLEQRKFVEDVKKSKALERVIKGSD